MFAVASAVQDVSQLPMSGFQFALFLFLLGWKAVDQGQMSRRQLLFLYADSCYFISMLTAVQKQRSRLFYVYLIFAESRN